MALTEAGYSVVLLDNFCNSNRSVSKRINQIVGKEIPCIEGDVRDTELLTQVLMDFKVDAVIHFAGLKAVGESVKEPLKYYDNNVAGSISLFEAMKKAQVKTIVFSSSATVYGEPKYLPLDEVHPLSPINPYGQTKLQVEQILQDLAKSDSSWRVCLLRYFNPVGAHGSGLIGEDPNGIPNNLMPYIMQVARGKLPHLNIFGNDYDTKDGTGERDYIHVVDLADGHVAALKYLENHSGCEVFNLGTGLPVSVLELVGAYEKFGGKKIPTKIASRRAGDLAVCYADKSKANLVLTWQALKDVDDMCSSGARWQTFRNSLDHSRE